MEHIYITDLKTDPRIITRIRKIEKQKRFEGFMESLVLFAIIFTGFNAVYHYNYYVLTGCILILIKKRIGPVILFGKEF